MAGKAVFRVVQADLLAPGDHAPLAAGEALFPTDDVPVVLAEPMSLRAVLRWVMVWSFAGYRPLGGGSGSVRRVLNR